MRIEFKKKQQHKKEAFAHNETVKNKTIDWYNNKKNWAIGMLIRMELK